MTTKKQNHKPTKKQALYQIASGYGKEAIQTLVEIMQNGDNDSVKLGAAKALLAKCIPDLKATELTAVEQEKLIIEIVKDDKLENFSRTYIPDKKRAY